MKLMIVDDEVIIRTGLTTVINWEELGFKLLPSAESAEQALEIIRLDPPHILLTDIRMGGMDGLELSYIVKKLYTDMEIVILSGYDDFEYVQKALRGGIGVTC
jgi:two-component system, response regulator YesN